MKITIGLQHSNEVSGVNIDSDGNKYYWNEGRNSHITMVKPDGTKTILTHGHQIFDDMAKQEEIGFPCRAMTPAEEADWEATY